MSRQHCRRKEIVSGGHDKEKFVERHYFLRLQKQFPEKWGGEGHMPSKPPVPVALGKPLCTSVKGKSKTRSLGAKQVMLKPHSRTRIAQ